MGKDINIEEKEHDMASEQEKETIVNDADANVADKNGSQEKAADSDSANESAADSQEKADTADKEEEKDPLAEALAQVDVLKDKYLRSVAEFDNYRKRTMKEKAELILNGSEKAVQAVLPVVDDMERAISNAAKSDDIAALKEGMELIYQKLNKVLGGLGVKKIETEDADFDTAYHEAVAMVPGMGDEKKGKVIDCVQAGYTLNDKVIRHAKVAVGQ